MNGTTALYMACANNFSNIVKILLFFGANPDVCEHEFAGKQYPLHIAVKNDNY